MTPTAEVALVSMPYISLERPSIALSILKAALASHGMSARVHYPNLDFAALLGPQLYDAICQSSSRLLLGEWTFSSAAFPDFEPGSENFFARCLQASNNFLPFSRELELAILRQIRDQAPEFVDRTAASIFAMKPRIVGCSSTFQQHCASLALLRRLKELEPSIVTVVGGANCETTMGLTTHRECPWVDFVVSGEAELVFPELCRRLLEEDRGQPDLEDLTPRGVIGPWLRDSDAGREATFSPPRAQLEEMDSSPIPDYDDYFAALKDSPISSFVLPGLLVETSRGCWWGEVSHCTFCGLNGSNMGYRSKSPQRVLQELSHLTQRYGLKVVEVVDNILDPSYFKDMIPELAARGDGYKIFVETRANLQRRHLQDLAASGIRWILPGIESLDDEILRAIAKGTQARRNLQMMKWARETGITLFWSLLYSIPGEYDENYARMAGWLPKISHLQPPHILGYVQYSRFSPYQMRPEYFGLELSPEPSYAFVYPWSRESLAHFAFFLEDLSRPRERILPGADEGPKSPGLRRLHRVCLEWQQAWAEKDSKTASPSTPDLYYEREADGSLVFTDTRACRRSKGSFRLDGLEGRLYEICDEARRPSTILKTLHHQGPSDVSRQEVEASLEALCGRELMLRLEDGYYFSLANRGRPMPLESASGVFCNRLRTDEEARAFREARHSGSLP